MSHNAHKRLKNGVVVDGGSLTPSVYLDANVIAEYKGIKRTPDIGNNFTFCEDMLISTDIYPGNTVRITFKDAEGWSNVDNMGDDALEATFEVPFSNSMFNTGTTYAT